MYIPKFYKNENTDEIKDFVHAHNFGILVTSAEGKIVATHIPFLLHKNKEGDDVLSGHISKANPQFKNISIQNEVLVIFQGPHSYVSSSWYDHENVPTWNYIAVHVYGKLKLIEGEELLQSLRGLVDKHEVNSERPVSIDAMSGPFLQNEIKGIAGFEIQIETIEAAKKLSQNRDEKNYYAIVSQLEKKGDANSKEIAKEMKKFKKR